MIRRLTLLLFPFLFLACGEEPDPYAPFTIVRGDIELTVDPAVGGRIASLKFRGQELLQTVRDSANLHWGSVGWTSPQSAWDWPPPVAFDSAPFTVTELREYRYLLEGPLDTASMLRMRKRVAIGPDDEIGLTYWVTNEGGDDVSVALWENTRLPYAGRIEFGRDSLRHWKDVLEPALVRDSVYVLHLDDRYAGKAGKIFTTLNDGYADYYLDGVRLRKESLVRDYYRVAPGQAPLELFASEPDGFVEFELQGDYRTLGPGESNNLRLRWSLSAGE